MKYFLILIFFYFLIVKGQNQKCQIEGCTLCDNNQICIKCKDNLILDKITGFCKKKCQEYQLLGQSDSKCKFICDKSEIEDYNSNSCLLISDYSQILQYPESNIKDLVITNITTLSNDQIVISFNICTFHIYDENLEFNQSIELLEQQNIISLQDDIGICSYNNKIIAYNFVNKLEEFNLDFENYFDFTKFGVFPFYTILYGSDRQNRSFIYDYKKQKYLFESQTDKINKMMILNNQNHVFLFQLQSGSGNSVQNKILYFKEEQIEKIEIEIEEYQKVYLLNEQNRIFILELQKQNDYLIVQFSIDFSEIKKLKTIQKNFSFTIQFIHEKTGQIMTSNTITKYIEVYLYSQQLNDIHIKTRIQYNDNGYKTLTIENELDQTYLIVIQQKYIYLYNLEDKSYFKTEKKLSQDSLFVRQKKQQMYIVSKSDRQYYLMKLQAKKNQIDFVKSRTLFGIQDKIIFTPIFLYKNQNSENLNNFQLLTSTNQKQNWNLDFSYPLSLQISKIQSSSYQYQYSKQVDHDGIIYIFMRNNEYNLCVYDLINVKTHETLFSLTNQCIERSDAYIFYLKLKLKEMIFFLNFYSLYDVDSKERVEKFSTEDQLDKQLQFNNYNDLMLLFSDGNGYFYTFDLENLKFKDMIKNDSLKISFIFGTFHYFYYYQKKINFSIFVKVNNIKIYEFNISNQTLNGLIYDGQDLNFWQLIYEQTNQLVIVKSSSLDILNQNFTPEKIKLSDQIQFTQAQIIGSYIFVSDFLKLYRYDFKTKQLVVLPLDSQVYGSFSFFKEYKLLFITKYVIKYDEMILIQKLQNDFESFNQIKLNQTLLLYFSPDLQLMFKQNIENKPISQTYFEKKKEYLFQRIISSNIQVQYYYDIDVKQIIRYNIVSKIKEKSYGFTEDYEKIYVDDYTDTFFYTQKDYSLYCFEPNSNSKQIYEIQKFNRGIDDIKFCYNQGLVFVKEQDNDKLFRISYKDKITKETIQFDGDFYFKFNIFCDQDLLINDHLKFFSLDGKSLPLEINSLDVNGQIDYLLVDMEKKIIICPYYQYESIRIPNSFPIDIIVNKLYIQIGSKVIQREDIIVPKNEDLPCIKLYYDDKNEILILLFCENNLIITFDCKKEEKKYEYKTQQKFKQNNIDSFLPQSIIILVDEEPSSIYIYNYLTNSTIIKNIQQDKDKKYISLIYDYNNQFIYIQTDYIQVYRYSNLEHIETLSFYDNSSNTIISSMQLISEINSLFVFTNDNQILTYDLIQTVVINEKSILDSIKINFLTFELDLIVIYNIQDSCLVLFQTTTFTDQLYVDTPDMSIPNKCDLYKSSQDSFIYITNQYILIVQIDYISKKFKTKSQIDIQIQHTDTLYDQLNQSIYLIDSFSQKIYQLLLNSEIKEIKQFGSVKYQYKQILIYNKNILYLYKNNLIVSQVQNIEKFYEVQLEEITFISFIKKLSSKQNVSFSEQLFEYNNDNSYDDIKDDSLILIVGEECILYIVNLGKEKNKISKKINYKVQNIVIDFQRKFIFSISDVLITYIYDYNLNQLSTIQNPCHLDTKICFDDKFIYSLCPNTIYFYDAKTFQQQPHSITKGFNDIISIRSLEKQQSFVMTQNSGLKVIQFVEINLNEIRILFTQDQPNLFIYESKIIKQEIQNKRYIHLKGLSWTNVVEFKIPYEYTEFCFYELKFSDMKEKKKQIKEIQNINKSGQQVKKIIIQLYNNQMIYKINIQEKPVLGIQLYLYSENRQNQIQWYNGTLDDDQSFSELIINNLTLSISGLIQINKNKNLNNLQMQNIDLVQIQNEIIIENIERVLFNEIYFKKTILADQEKNDSVITFRNCQKVAFISINLTELNIKSKTFFKFENVMEIYFQDFKISKGNIDFDQKQGSDALIIFRNCQKIVFKGVTLTDLNIERGLVFKFENIKEINIYDMNIFGGQMKKCIQISKSDQLIIQDLHLLNFKINYQESIIIEGTLIAGVKISSITISDTEFIQLFNFFGCFSTELDNVKISQSKNITLFQIQSYLDNKNNQTSPSIQTSISNIDLTKSGDIGIVIESKNTEIKNCQIQQNLITKSFIYSKQTNINILNCNFTENFIHDDNDYYLIQLESFNNILIKNTSFYYNTGNIMYLFNQNKRQQIELNNVNFLNNTHTSNSIIIIDQSQNILLYNSTFKNNNNTKQNNLKNGVLNIQNSRNLTIYKTNFTQNKSYGRGGSVYISNTKNILISFSWFENNESTQNSGGAIFIESSLSKLNETSIKNCNFTKNKAVQGYGGAIALSNINLKLKENVIKNNQAAIGGGVYYQQIIPSDIQDQNTLFKQNEFEMNESTLYGDNIGSTIRKIKYGNKEYRFEIIKNGKLKIMKAVNVKSGGYMNISDIYLIDEENNNYKYKNKDLFQNKEIKDIIETSALNHETSNLKLQIKQLENKAISFKDPFFQLNSTISYLLNQTASFFISTNLIPSLKHPNQSIFIEEKFLALQFEISFRDCVIGEIEKNFLESVICEECPDQKYSLNKNDLSCQLCPISADKCFGSTILLKDGYWREDDQSDQIIQCSKQPYSCQSQNQNSKNGCIEGYVGPLCEQCDNQGQIWPHKYSNFFTSNSCSKCTDKYFIFIINSILFFIISFIYLHFTIKRIVKQSKKSLTIYYLRLIGIIRLSNSGKQINVKDNFTKSIFYNKALIFQTPEFFKILIDHLQIISVIRSFDLKLPIVFNYGTEAIGNPLQIASFTLDCFFPYEILNGIPYWVFKFIWSAIVPFILILTFVLYQKIKQLFRFKSINSRYYKTAIIYIYLYFFPSLITTISQSVNCRSIGQHTYSQADLLIKCMDFEKHLLYILCLILPFFLVFCVGFVLYLIKKIRYEKQQNNSTNSQYKFQFLFQSYKDSLFLWDIVRLIYKSFIMMFSIVFLEYATLKVYTINVILISYYLSVAKLNPSVFKQRNQLESESLIISMISLNLSLYYSLFKEIHQNLSSYITVFIFLLNGYFILKVFCFIYSKQISYDPSKQTFFEKILFKIKQKYPHSLQFINIKYKTSIRSLRKFNIIKKNIKEFSNLRKTQKEKQDDVLNYHFNKTKQLTPNSPAFNINDFSQALNKSNLPLFSPKFFQKEHIFKSDVLLEGKSIVSSQLEENQSVEENIIQINDVLEINSKTMAKIKQIKVQVINQ